MVRLAHIVVAIAMILSIVLPGCGEEPGWYTEGIRDRFIEILQPTDEQLEQLEAGTGTLQLRGDQVDTLSDYTTQLVDDLQPRLEQAQWQEVKDILEGTLTQGEVDLENVDPVTEAIHDSLISEAAVNIGVYTNLVRLPTESTATVDVQSQLAEGSQRSTCTTVYTPRNRYHGDKHYEYGGDEQEDTVGWRSESIAAASSYSGAIGVDAYADIGGGASAYALQRILINVPVDATDIDITARLLYSDGTFHLFLGGAETGIITVYPYRLHQDATVLEEELDPMYGWDDALQLALTILGLGFGAPIGTVAHALSGAWTGLDAIAYQSALQEYGEERTIGYSTASLPAGDYIFEIGVYARVESYLDIADAFVIGMVPEIEVTMNIPSITLDIASTDGGYVIEPGEGAFPCCPGEDVDIVAVSYQGYRFTGWTGDVGTIDRADIQSTYITMNDNYSITANFEEIPSGEFYLTTSSTSGGSVTTPGEGTFTYDSGTVVDLVATPDSDYQFVNWTGDVSTIADVNDASTTITMNGNYYIAANFEEEPGEVPELEWIRLFDACNSYDAGYSVQQTLDGGYIITGKYGCNHVDVFLIKTDSSGIEDWRNTFGGSDNDYGYSVQQTSDGGYIITGYTESYGAGLDDVYLIKTDATGVEQWSNTYGGSDDDHGYSVQQTSDGGYIITGYTESYGAGLDDVYLIKTDATGAEQWSNTYGSSGYEYGHSVQQTSDGGYIIAGYTTSYGAGYSDFYLIKTDAAGVEQWSNTYGGPELDKGQSVQQTSDGGYIIVGQTRSYCPASDVYLIKTDATGAEQWSKTYGGESWDRGFSVQQASDGGYVIAGHSKTMEPVEAFRVYVIKTDPSGNEDWSVTYGGTMLPDTGYSVQQTSDGGYVIAGQMRPDGPSYADVCLIKLGDL